MILVDMALVNASLAATLVQQLRMLNEGNFNPDRGVPDPEACAAAVRYGGYYGPFVGV
jgi:hypothetical protein|tara:strand:+ start:511 stop:684 length:174 start_codon:yes stop_codon:yes gene_type:complete